jgi:hypothetical protein
MEIASKPLIWNHGAMTFPGLKVPGSYSFFVYFRPAKNEKSGQSRDALSRSHDEALRVRRDCHHCESDASFASSGFGDDKSYIQVLLIERTGCVGWPL